MKVVRKPKIEKETMRLMDIGLPQSKNKVNSIKQYSKARIESKMQ